MIRTWQRAGDPNMPWHIYLEGDGYAWKTWREPSTDPTPRNLQVLAMAGADRGANVLYVARPCQFVMSPRCRVEDWTGARLSEGHVAAMREVILSQTGTADKVLIGFSGGGGMAILLAPHLPGLRGLVTLAGNLNHADFTAYHDVTPMSESMPMGPSLMAAAHIPQWHFRGEDDDIIPPNLTEKMLAPIAASPCVHQVTLPKVSHQYGWLEQWPMRLGQVNFTCP